MLVYNDTQWVSYMNDTTKANRIQIYKLLKFLETAD